jgi:cellulose synthase/poly-beta-1,6-N-acetylglucosamine synthase-like glycosyltransferase
MTVSLHLIFALLLVPAVLACGYLLVMTLLSARLPAPPPSSRTLRFDVIVPAHNESAVIENCVASLKRLDWPGKRFRILVIADNCDDSTAPLARAAGAKVLERNDTSARGKGYALLYAFDYSRACGFADAVAVVDADSEVSPNLLEAFAARIEAGAGAIQADYGVLNPEASWRTRLMAIAHGAFHTLRSYARERLGLSCGLRGNGWCITHATLERVPQRSFSLTEDLEYGIELGLAGVRVHYAGEAWANAEMAVSESVAARQRQRWEDGRFDLIRSRVGPLIAAAWRQRSAVCLDLALDLIVLPLSLVALYCAVLVAGATAAALYDPAYARWVVPTVACAACVVAYVLRGVALSGRGLAGLADLAAAPFFVLWKLVIGRRRYDRTEWAPTRRRGP